MNSWLQEVRTRFLTVSHLLQLTITLISSSSFFFFLGDEEFDGHFTNYYEGNKFKFKIIFSIKRTKHSMIKLLGMSHQQSQALLLHCLKTKMTSMILWILWTALYQTSSLHHCILCFLVTTPFRPHFSFPFRYCVCCLPTEQHHLCKRKEEVKKAITSKDETTYLN